MFQVDNTINCAICTVGSLTSQCKQWDLTAPRRNNIADRFTMNCTRRNQRDTNSNPLAQRSPGNSADKGYGNLRVKAKVSPLRYYCQTIGLTLTRPRLHRSGRVRDLPVLQVMLDNVVWVSQCYGDIVIDIGRSQLVAWPMQAGWVQCQLCCIYRTQLAHIVYIMMLY